MFPVWTTASYILRLAAIIAELFPIAADTETEICLFKNDVSPDANMTNDTFVEADYAGYAHIPLVMSDPTVNDQGIIVSKSNLCDFRCAGGVETQIVYGVYLRTEGAEVIAAQRFETPQVMGGALPTAVTGVWRFSDPLTNYGWVDVEA